MTHRFLLTALLALLLCTAVFADLHDPANSADYLIITPASVVQANPWIGQLAAWRAEHGRTAMVVSTDSIWAEFGNGNASDTTLKAFLWYAYRHWSAPQLKDVFIIGWHNVVPSHIQPDSSQGAAYNYLSDFFYSTDPDSSNHLPVLNIGRLPWDPDSGALWNFYTKITAYELAANEDWQRRVQIIADSSDGGNNYSQLAQPSADAISSQYTVVRNYLSYPVGDPWHGDRNLILENLNAGSYLFMHFCRYRGADIWGGTLGFTAATADSLTNGHRLPIVYGISQDAGVNGTYAGRPIPRAFLSNPNGGAIGYIATSSAPWIFNGTVLRRTAARIATSDSVETLGDISQKSLSEYVRLAPNDPWRPGTPIEMTARSTMLLGDPGLRLPARPSAVTDNPSSAPAEFRLVGNYPNPFNPSTQIQFELARSAEVSLRVLNVLGQQVATLVDAPREAGTHTITWNAEDYPSGIYFAVFETGSVRQVKKMMLLK